MLKPIIAALIAATALVPPALAQDRHGRGGDRGSRSESSSHQNRGGDSGRHSNDRSQQQARPAQAPQQVRQAPARAPQQQFRGNRGNSGQQAQGQPGYRPGQGVARGQQIRSLPAQQAQPQQFRGNRGQQGQGQQQFRGNRNGNAGVVPQGQRSQQYRGNNGNRGNDARRGNNGNRGNDWRANNNRGNNSAWSRNWRGDSRYNWRDRRAHDRNRYRLPRYYAPRGYSYGYNRFSIGFTLGSLLFSQQYWLNDPFYYGLPPAYGEYRWVRYYNDALLVDIRTGMVVDVEYDIFW